MLEQLHRASQYLAAFGINLIAKQDDDSHTNLGFDKDSKTLATRATDNGHQLFLDILNFSMIWSKDGDVISKVDLDGTKHEDILGWANIIVSQQELSDSFDFNFHYELPYSVISNDFVFSLDDKAELTAIADQLVNAQNVFDSFLSSNSFQSEIRVWPHHFDLGLYTAVKDGLDLGVGLAIPDSIQSSHYYYVSGWSDGKSVSTENYPDMEVGKWMSPEWDGAILPSSSDQDQEEIKAFLNQAKDGFLAA